MNDKQFIKSFGVKEQAYLILVGLNGSWIYEATHKELEQEDYCQRIVDQFWSNYAESMLSEVAVYAQDTISRCDECGARKIFKCLECN